MTDLTNALNRIFAWLEKHSPRSASGFQPGLSSKEIEERLNVLPFCVSQEVRELYRWRNGDEIYSPVFGYLSFVDLDTACDISESVNGIYPQSRYLFPVFDFDGEYFAVECDMAMTETSPVFHVSDCYDVNFAFINLTSMMLALAECYETGVYGVKEDGRLEVVDTIEFGRIRKKYNPGTVESLYVGGW
jgi:hypothetical protein